MESGKSNVIDIMRIGGSKVTDEAAWLAIRRAAVAPALEICAAHLSDCGIESETITGYNRRQQPYMILRWNGRGSLQGDTLSLQFTFGGDLICFELALVRTALTVFHQGNLLREIFSRKERQVGVRIQHRASWGLGKALQVEEGPVPILEWKTFDRPEYSH